MLVSVPGKYIRNGRHGGGYGGLHSRLLRCWATGLSEITSRKKLSAGHGNILSLIHILLPNKQYKIAGETLYIYAPLANRLGLNKIKTELEDLSFKYEHPEEYASFTSLIPNL